MLNVTTSFALPREGAFLLGTVEQLQRMLRFTTYGLQDLAECF